MIILIHTTEQLITSRLIEWLLEVLIKNHTPLRLRGCTGQVTIKTFSRLREKIKERKCREMFLKLLVKLLLKDNKSYVSVTNLKGKTYVITIKEYEPLEPFLKQWESALGKENS